MSTPNLYLIHGWAANGEVFNDLRRRLPENRKVFAPNLPGHGDAPWSGNFDIAEAADGLAAQISEPSDILGWSLGGLVALHLAARYPDKVRRLILCASFAKFQAAEDYPEGLKNPALGKMTALFEQDYPKYMRQFLELQLLHSLARAEIIEAVLPDVVKHGTPAALSAALEALSAADARSLLPEIKVPVLLIYGNKDTITPPRMGEYMARHLPDARLQMIDKAAHAPFLSHTVEFMELITEFVLMKK